MSTTQRPSTPKLTTSNLRTNDAGPSTPESRHRKRGSIATPIDSIANSPTGRKWSSSSTPQDAAVAPEEKVNKETMISQMVVGGVIASIVLTGIMYSLIHSTSLNTSLPHSHLPERANYLARKSNILNQWFVKKAWFWTSLGYLSHLASAPPSRSSRWTRLSVFALATACWLLFTTWFFGAALGDRIIALSGGDCAVMLPKEWGLTRPAIQHLLPSDTSASIMKVGEDLILPLPQSFCSSRLPLTAKTFPDLFALLPESLAEQRTKAPLPRFYKGFDISGHTFLLTLSTLVLCRELAPSWSKLVRTGRVGSSVGRGGQVHAVATLFGSALVGLWLVMLGATAVYFHNPPEKLSGLALGLLTATIVNFLTPEVAPSAVDATLLSTRETLQAGKRALDENAARRGQVIDDGAIIEDEDALSSKPKQD